MRFLLLFCIAAGTLHAESAYEAALALVTERRLPEARAALEKVVSSDPNHAAAWHQLGLLWRSRRDNTAYEEAVKCLARAVEIEPNNALFLSTYGGTSLELAGRTRSISAAKKGRDAMEKAVQLDPNNLDAREGLFQFYLQAPFIVGGSKSKAEAQLAEIRRRSPDRGLALAVSAKVRDKAYTEAFALCERALATDPANAMASYQLARVATASGERLDAAWQQLQKGLQKEPSGKFPTRVHLLNLRADLEQRLGRASDARATYAAVLEIDPNNRIAKAALEKLH